MIERFVGTSATVILAAIREDDDRPSFFSSLSQIVGRPQDCVVECRHCPGAQTKSPRRQIAARREVLHLLDLDIKIVNGGDVFVSQAVEETNRCRSPEGEA